MGLSRVFGLLAVALCLVACLYAHALSETEAKGAVKDLQTLTAQTLRKAQQKYTNAERVKQAVQLRKEKAQNAASEAETAANGNEEAKVFVATAKSEMQQCLQLHPDAKESAEKVFPVMEQLKNKARQLDNEAKINVEPKEGSPDYTHVTESVNALKARRLTLEGEIDAAQLQLNAVDAALAKLDGHASKAQVANYQAQAVVSAAKIKTLLGETDKDVASFHKKSGEINANLQEIEGHLKATTGELMLIINNFHTKADTDARIVTGLIREVQTAQQAIRQEKTYADDVLTEILALTEESKVREKAGSVKYFYNRAAVQLRKIKTALEKANTRANSSNTQKQNTLNALEAHNNKPGTVEDKETNKPGQTAEETTTKVTSEETKEQKDTNPSQHLQDTTRKPTSKSKKERKDTNPVQYVEKSAKSPGIKGNISPYDTNSDGAITASFSLLLALIACTALN